MDHTHSHLRILADDRGKLHDLEARGENAMRLAEKLAGDMLIASVVTAAVSPFLNVIDKSIVERSNGASLIKSAANSVSSMVRNPVAYARSPAFLWMWSTYAITYATANSIKTLCENNHQKQGKTTTTTTMQVGPTSSTKSAIFLGTTAANCGASIMKDRAYARLFGETASTVVPKISYGLWVARDLTVVGSSFVLPEFVAPLLKESLGEAKALQAAQVLTPMAAQLIAAPLHFGGLDCYNRNLSHMSWSQRVLERGRFLAQGFWSVLAVRMVRVLPGYGIAGVWNRQLRDEWHASVEERHIIRQQQRRKQQQQEWTAASSSLDVLLPQNAVLLDSTTMT